MYNVYFFDSGYYEVIDRGLSLKQALRTAQLIAQSRHGVTCVQDSNMFALSPIAWFRFKTVSFMRDGVVYTVSASHRPQYIPRLDELEAEVTQMG